MKQQLSRREKQSVALLAADLDVLRPGEAAMGERALEVLEQIGIEYPHSYTLEQSSTGVVTLDEMTGRHFDVVALRRVYDANRFLQTTLYDPLAVKAHQRNRAIQSSQLQASTSPIWTRLRQLWAPHIHQAHDQLRVLVCDGSAMLGWVGGFGREDFTWRERDKLQLLVPVLRRRLLHEHRAREAGLVHSALDAVLEALPGPAFLLDDRLRPVHRNRAAGDARVELDWMHLTPVEARGLPRHFLARERPRAANATSLPSFALKYGLSAQETKVLALVVKGHTNRAIAVELRCSERTVEVHVTRVLEKTDSESRGAVVARHWRDEN